MQGARTVSCLYFGTFNPIHAGHLMIAEAVLNQFGPSLGLERICFIPAGVPPHRYQEQDLADAKHRLNMVRLATARHPRFWVLQDEIGKAGPSYTVETIESLLARGLVQAPVPMIIGSDALTRLSTWHRPEDLAELVCFLQMPRPGTEPVQHLQINGQTLPLRTHAIEMPTLSLSSSWVREQARQGKSLRYFVPEPVREYIRDNGLYASDSRSKQ
jgi:nicotinate-nucleotide adenylyltransferase